MTVGKTKTWTKQTAKITKSFCNFFLISGYRISFLFQIVYFPLAWDDKTSLDIIKMCFFNFQMIAYLGKEKEVWPRLNTTSPT